MRVTIALSALTCRVLVSCTARRSDRGVPKKSSYPSGTGCGAKTDSSAVSSIASGASAVASARAGRATGVALTRYQAPSEPSHGCVAPPSSTTPAMSSPASSAQAMATAPP